MTEPANPETDLSWYRAELAACRRRIRSLTYRLSCAQLDPPRPVTNPRFGPEDQLLDIVIALRPLDRRATHWLDSEQRLQLGRARRLLEKVYDEIADEDDRQAQKWFEAGAVPLEPTQDEEQP